MFATAVALKFPKELGIIPDKLFWKRCKTWSLESSHNCGWRLPSNILDHKMRNLRAVSLPPTHLGIFLSPRSSVTNPVQFFMDGGSFPESLFLLRCNDSSWVKWLIELEIPPKRLLFSKFQYFICPKQCRVSFVNWLFEI